MYCKEIKKRLAECAAKTIAATAVVATVGAQIVQAEPAIFTAKGSGTGAGNRVIGRYLSNLNNPIADFDAYGSASDNGVRIAIRSSRPPSNSACG